MREQWINLQASLLGRLPAGAGAYLSALRHLPSFATWWLSQDGRRHTEAVLGPYRDRYRGCRCVVIGNGPSLQSMRLSLLADEFTFGLNRIYLKFDEWGFETSFLCVINRFVVQQFAEEIAEAKALKIVNWSYRTPKLRGPDVAYVETKPATKPDGRLLNGFYAGGGTVTSLALQAAHFMGFSQVILIGVDHNYHRQGMPNEVVRSEGGDRSHFSKEYFGQGVVWQLPDLSAMERGYRLSRQLFEADGREVVDATSGGKLDVFPKVEFEGFLASSNAANKRQFGA